MQQQVTQTCVSNNIFVALFAVLFFTIFNFTIVLMSGVYIVSDLGGDNLTSIYGVSFYGIGNAIGIPLGRALPRRFGSVRMMWICLLLFALGSWLCSVAPNYPFFIGARLYQGIVAGPLFALGNQLFTLYAPRQKGIIHKNNIDDVFNYSSFRSLLGGWMAYDYSWRWTFYVDIPCLCFLAWYIGTRLKGYQPALPERTFDGIGYCFYVAAIFCLGFVLTMGQELDWQRSPLIVTMVYIGIPCLLFFILWSLNHPYPILEFRLFKEPLFTFGIISLIPLFSTYFAMVILLSLWLKLYINYSQDFIALLFAIMAVSGIIPALLMRKEVAKIDNRVPLAIAIILLALSSFYGATFTVDVDFERIAYSRVLAGFGLVFFLPPLFRLCFHSLPEGSIIDVVVMFQVVRSLASGLGGALYTILWERRQVFYHDRLGSKLTAFSQQTQDFFTKASNFHLEGKEAVAKLEFYLQRQSTALALEDCFYLMGWLMVVLLVLLALTCIIPHKSFSSAK